MMYYGKSTEDVFKEFEVPKSGLTSDEAGKRLEKYGPNDLKSGQSTSLRKLIFSQFKDPLIYILLIAAVFTFIIHEYIDMWVILGVVLINAIVGFFQEFKAEKAMQAIKNLTTPQATVLRDSEKDKIDTTGLVPGDIVFLSSGKKIPADLRLFQTRHLKIDESMFTGESQAAMKNTQKIEGKNIPLADQTNMAFMGSVVVRGKGKGIVIATADKTELGRISQQVTGKERGKTPLQKRLMFFSKMVGLLSVGMALTVFLIGLFKSKPIEEMILFSISMAVSVIPEGLPIIITITMAIGMKRMAERNAVIRKLIAVEILGSCDYICSDKTGTITENVMVATKAYAGGKTFEFKGQGYKPEGEILRDGEKVEEDEDLKMLLLTGALCNSADLYNEQDQWKIEGDPTEGALLVSARKYRIDVDEEDDSYEMIDEVPFDPDKKYMAVLREKKGGSIIFVKGAPEKILEFTDTDNKETLRNEYKQMASNGLRVLAFGYKKLKAGKEGPMNLAEESGQGLTFAGFQGIIDPPRESAIQAIKDTKKAGITTTMVTGDHKITAESIARDIGILDEEDMVTDGKELDDKGESFLRENVEKIRVYARVSPEHKLRVVEALKEKGHIVAVTGDGVNDAPALKTGHIGVSMGTIGTDVAKEASEMVLKDDNFATIFEAVKVGRVIFENIRKVVFFLLGSAAGEVGIIILALLMNMPLPFLATQILWINLVTNGLQDIALAYEPGETGMFVTKPRNPKENIINFFVWKRLFLVGVTMAVGTVSLFWLKLNSGASLPYARTVAFNTVVFFQFFHVLNSRSFDKSIFSMSPFSNMFLFISLFLSIMAQLSVLYVPALKYVFHTEALDLSTWIQIISVSFSILLVMEADKFIRSKLK